MKRTLAFLLALGFLWVSASAQDHSAAIRLTLDHLQARCADYGITAADAADVLVTSAYSSKKSGVTHVYFSQAHQGIEVLQAAGNANIGREGSLINMHVRFVANLAGKVSHTAPSLGAGQAVQVLAKELGIALPAVLPITAQEGGPMQKVLFAKGDYALEPIPVRLAYYPDEDLGVRLVWEVQFYERKADHHWLAGVDAVSGEIRFMRDQVIHCDFGSPADGHVHHAPRDFSKHLSPEFMPSNTSGYNVYPVPVESPNHGSRTIVADPADLIASPYGWHDFDGQPGADTTITFGNNVHAYQDTLNIDEPSGDEPDGGPDLLFDHPLNLNALPSTYIDAAVTNLFFWNNVMHDVWYQYGFDEPAGNFQFNNYGKGGEEGDYIRAQAQDGGGTNNANFSSGADGSNARIQMYLWTGGSGEFLLTIDTPSTIAGSYVGAEAGFGPGLPTDVPITAALVLVDDGTANPTLGCNTFVNAAEVEGRIALIDRGDCPFADKVVNAQDAGAVAAIICNNTAGAPFAMGGDGSAVTIPSIMISQADCELIKIELINGITASLLGSGAGAQFRDGDFDNGIICHEYGHGISIRLTGGPGTGFSCLSNAEQMGEGWSDYVGLMLTMEEGDLGPDIRGIGTFAIDEPVDGVGIRPAPYSTDMTINPYTYAATNNVTNISQPHGIGFVWASMLWDMTWLLIDQYGFDPDFYHGTGGNNIAMQLVTEGMKLQPCNPGFIDGRDAILLADSILYGGANQCLIWDAFARRGLGASASQGSSSSRVDQVEAFDLPYFCLIPDFPPTAAIGFAYASDCAGEYYFKDESADIPQSWFWDFGDGNTSTQKDPIHSYGAEGDYLVTLIVTNTLGADTVTQLLSVDYIDAPLADAAPACEGSPATLTAQENGYTINWYLNGELLFSGTEFVTPPISGPTTFLVESEEKKAIQSVGPPNSNFGLGTYHNTGFTGTIIFEAHVPFVLESAWVNAGNAGNRKIELFDMSGNTLDSVIVFIPEGQSVVTLNLEVPAPGMYQVGGTTINLYRNSLGAQYPYELEGIVTLLNSNATNNPEFFYYYLYDWKVREWSCFSEQVPVTLDPQESPSAQFTYLQGGAQLTFQDASVGATSWFWDFGDGNTSTQQSPPHFYLEDGEYEVVLTVSNGQCESTYSQTIVIINSGIGEITGLKAFELYPTVGSGQFTLEADLDRVADLEIEVRNALGQVVHELVRPQTSVLREQVTLPELAAGAYFVQLRVDGQRAVKRYVLVK